MRKFKKILDYLCLQSEHQKIYFLWRPRLPDPKDDHLLELAVASGTKLIVTHNTKDFKGIEEFGIRSLRAKKEDFRKILAKVPSRKPITGDEL